MSDLVHVGTVVRSRGIRGEVAVVCPAGHPERWVGLASALCGVDAEHTRRRAIERAWLHGRRLVVHFAGVASIQDATELVGCRLFLPEDELPVLPADSWYTFELVGVRVINMEDEDVGRVVDTLSGQGQDRMVIETLDGRRVEIPMVRAIISKVDLEARTVRIDPPEGLVAGEPEVVAACAMDPVETGGPR